MSEERVSYLGRPRMKKNSEANFIGAVGVGFIILLWLLFAEEPTDTKKK